MAIFDQHQVAPRYDGKTRDFPVDAAGVLKSCHPVDHMMMIGLCTRRGSWKSSPEVGHDLFNIQLLGAQSSQAGVERSVLAAEPIATLIKNGDVEILSVQSESGADRAPNGLLVAVDYRNLRLDRSKVQRITNVT